MGTPIPLKSLEFDMTYHLRRMLDGPAVMTVNGSLPFAKKENKDKESFEACDNCGDRLKPPVKCMGCRKVSYCGKECQVTNWKELKLNVKKQSHKAKK